MIRYDHRLLLRSSGFVYFCLAALAQASGETDMAVKVRRAVTAFPASVGIYAKNLDTGRSFSHRADERVRTASTIKLPVMIAVFQAVEDGKARWTDTIALTEAARVSGSGVIREMSDGLAIPIRDLMRLMIVVSDNTATNLLIDRFGADYVNEQLDKLAIANTRCLRKIMGDRNALKEPDGWSQAGLIEENKKYGIGYSTPRDMVALLEKIELGQAVSADSSAEMIRILKRQQYRDGIGRAWRLDVASKSGALDALRSDAGIVYTTKGRLAVSVTVDGMKRTDWSPDNPGNKLISEITGHLLKGLAQ